jgi:hypothetical protein
MSPGRTKDELKILTPVGQFGQGWNSSVFWNAVDSGVDAIIADAGSTDSGPGRLALGKTAASPAGYKRDFGELVKACHTHGVRCLIGSAGGSGSNEFVDMSTRLIKEIVEENGYRPMKVVSIYAEIPKETVRQKLKDNLMSPCGQGVPELKQVDIDSAVRIVAQMGLEPYVAAMNANPDFDIIIGGRSYDPAPYAAFCLYHGFEDLGECPSMYCITCVNILIRHSQQGSIMRWARSWSVEHSVRFPNRGNRWQSCATIAST